MARDSQLATPAPPQSSQQSEPHLPQSPESLSQSEVFASHHPTTVTTDASHRVHPATLHLKPVTWESLAEIDFPSGERFEIVDGLLVWLPMGNGTDKHQRIIKALVKFLNMLARWWAVSCLDVEVESISGNSEAANSRIPDVIITRRRPGSPSDSSGSERTPRKHVLLQKDKPAYAQIEVTSKSTRTTDLTAKWVQYCSTGVMFYYIIDLYGLETSRRARVIVGSQVEIQGWTRCKNGDPDGASSSSSSNTETHHNLYYKKVYTENDLIDVGIFQDQPLTASQLMSSTVINQKAEEIKHRNKNLSTRNQNLSTRNQNLSTRNQNLSTRNQNLSTQNQNLSRQNTSKDREIAMLRSENARLRGSSSNSRSETECTRQNHKPNSSSQMQSAASQPASPTNSPVKKRHKHRK